MGKMTLEKLLNTLIQRGWKPFGINYYCYFNIREKIEIIGGPFGGGEYILEKTPSLRDLCSKESNLWQFVCENGMVGDGKLKHNWVSQVERGLDVECKRKVYPTKYEYRLIESALKDESELEEFLLSSIVIKDEN